MQKYEKKFTIAKFSAKNLPLVINFTKSLGTTILTITNNFIIFATNLISDMNRTSVIERIKNVMHRLKPQCETILYGSEARGEASASSDIDLLVLVDSDHLDIAEEKRIIKPLYEIEVETGVIISPLVMLRKTWENRSINTPFYLNVKRDGIIL